MGTGRSGLSKGTTGKRSRTTMRNNAMSMGYRLTMSDDDIDKYNNSLKSYFKELDKFQSAMKEDDEMIKAA